MLIETTIDYKPTPEELAQAFWDMMSDEQARFFNQLGRLGDGNMPIQLEYIRLEKALTEHGRSVMALIGEYAEKLKVY